MANAEAVSIISALTSGEMFGNVTAKGTGPVKDIVTHSELYFNHILFLDLPYFQDFSGIIRGR